MRPIVSNVVNTAAKPPFMMTPPAMAQPRSPWHSPVPYLFGGLAVMLGLIAFALLILSCSYWRNISGWNNNGGGGGEDDVEKEGESNKQVKVNNYEEKIVVIMAGEVKPTFLATPVVFTKASSYGDKNGKLEEEKAESGEKVVKEEMGEDDHQPLPIITENSENHHERQQTSQDQSC